MSIMKGLCAVDRTANKVLDFIAPLGDLFIRYWVARVFFLAGMTKIKSWDTTVFLFTHEYNVPVLSPVLAAYLGTATELIIPVLLVLGLGGRIPALILFIFNIVAVYSYPFLLTEAGAVGLNDHFYWGVLIMVLMLYGYRQISLDYLLKKYFCKSSD